MQKHRMMFALRNDLSVFPEVEVVQTSRFIILIETLVLWLFDVSFIY